MRRAPNKAYDDKRFAGLPGHDASAQYVFDRAQAAGYDVRFQEFEYDAAEDLSVLEKVTPLPVRPYARGFFQEFIASTQAPEGEVTATLYAIDLKIPSTGGSTSGCEGSDFTNAGFQAGGIALVQRGTCNFIVKVRNAAAAGASAVIIMNEGNTAGRTELDFNPAVAGATIPTAATSFPAGLELARELRHCAGEPERWVVARSGART